MPVASILLSALLACGEPPPNTPGSPEIWNLTLPDAIRTALDNAESIRVIRLMISALGGQALEIPDFDPRQFFTSQGYPENPEGPAAAAKPVLIGRVNADDDPEQFRANATALVLSVEEQYWSLWQQSSLCRTRAAALAMAREAMERGEARVEDDRGTPRAVAVAAAAMREHIEHFRIEFESVAAERDEAESRLRKIMGLEPSDHRRLVPATAPRTDDSKPDWEVGIVRMMEQHPDIVRQKRKVEAAQLRWLVANALVPAEIIGEGIGTWTRLPLRTIARYTQHQLGIQRKRYDAIAQERSVSLCRRVLDLLVVYRELRVAVEARAAASALLEKERAGHMAGRITTEDYLDALDRWCLSVAEEGRACARYNRAFVLLDQDRGMVLDAANIAVSDGPKPRRPYAKPRNTNAADD